MLQMQEFVDLGREALQRGQIGGRQGVENIGGEVLGGGERNDGGEEDCEFEWRRVVRGLDLVLHEVAQRQRTALAEAEHAVKRALVFDDCVEQLAGGADGIG